MRKKLSIGKGFVSIAVVVVMSCISVASADFVQATATVSTEVKKSGASIEQSYAAYISGKTYDFKSSGEKLSYALGMILGGKFRRQNMTIDTEYYAKGLQDGLAGGDTMLTETEARTVMNTLVGELRRNGAPAPASYNKLPSDIKISFKLDPRLTQGQYLGDRWVTPSTYTSTQQAGKEVIVPARAHGSDSGGKPVTIIPEWIPSDPQAISIVPSVGNEVKIIVKRVGRFYLEVATQEIKKVMIVEATDNNGAMQVRISQ